MAVYKQRIRLEKEARGERTIGQLLKEARKLEAEKAAKPKKLETKG